MNLHDHFTLNLRDAFRIWQKEQKNSSLLNEWNHEKIFFYVVDSKRVNFKIDISSLFLPSLAPSTHTQCDASTYSPRCAIIIQSFPRLYSFRSCLFCCLDVPAAFSSRHPSFHLIDTIRYVSFVRTSYFIHVPRNP